MSAPARDNGGYWNRDAYVNEGVTFDAGYAHQQQTGTYHYHADPIALRYLLGDHVDYNPATKTYNEDTNAPTKHSPILGVDGGRLSGLRALRLFQSDECQQRHSPDGFRLRSAQRPKRHGQSRLSDAARTTIPHGRVRAFSVSCKSKPARPFQRRYPLGRYMEDNDYLGDLTNSATGTNYQQGVDFDLDEYNGRWCVTPEFPNGTYAYFVAIDSNGTPVFPYNIGRGFYGNPAGGSVSTITETVVTNFLGGTNLASSAQFAAREKWNGHLDLERASKAAVIKSRRQQICRIHPAGRLLPRSISPNQITGSYTNSTVARPTILSRRPHFGGDF